MDKKIKKIAELIFSIALYEGYQTTLKQTIINLQNSPQDRIFQNPKDQYIFDDLYKAINFGSQFSKITVEIFKGINFKMNSLGEGQPEHPGMLRKNVPISVGDYVPLDTTRKKIDSADNPAVSLRRQVSDSQLFLIQNIRICLLRGVAEAFQDNLPQDCQVFLPAIPEPRLSHASAPPRSVPAPHLEFHSHSTRKLFSVRSHRVMRILSRYQLASA